MCGRLDRSGLAPDRLPRTATASWWRASARAQAAVVAGIRCSRLDARYIDQGGSRAGLVEITNHGPGDVYELDLNSDSTERLIARGDDDFPVPKLRAGKSVSVLRSGSLARNGSYFTVTVTGKTVDGQPIQQDIFVSGA